MARLAVWGVKKLLCKGSSMLGAARRLNKGLVRKGLFWSNWVLWAETPLIRDLLQESGFMVSKQWDFREGICSPMGFHRNLSVICVPLSRLSAPVFLHFQSDYFNNMDRCGWTVELSKWYLHKIWQKCCSVCSACWCWRCELFVKFGVSSTGHEAYWVSTWIFSWCWFLE